MSDLAGNDIGYAVRTSLGLTDAAARDPAVEYSADIADALVEAGRLGQKAGKGWYLYEQPRVRLVRISTSRPRVGCRAVRDSQTCRDILFPHRYRPTTRPSTT